MAERAFSPARLPGFTTVAMLVFVALYLPILMLVVYSFNAGNSVAEWRGFSLQWFARAWANDQIREATIRSLVLASSAAVIATTVATMAALGTTRRRAFKGQRNSRQVHAHASGTLANRGKCGVPKLGYAVILESALQSEDTRTRAVLDSQRGTLNRGCRAGGKK